MNISLKNRRSQLESMEIELKSLNIKRKNNTHKLEVKEPITSLILRTSAKICRYYETGKL
jgi:hypothetical protein